MIWRRLQSETPPEGVPIVVLCIDRPFFARLAILHRGILKNLNTDGSVGRGVNGFVFCWALLPTREQLPP